MPRSPLAPSADGPTPVRRRAVIAATIGTSASTVGLVLLGIGSAAASIGPSPGPAAGPLPKAPSTSVLDTSVSEIAAVEIGSPPIPAETAFESVTVTATDVVAQAPPTLPGRQTIDSAVSLTDVASEVPLPTTGTDRRTTVIVAWVTLVSGVALLAIRHHCGLHGRARVAYVRVTRHVAGRHDD